MKQKNKIAVVSRPIVELSEMTNADWRVDGLICSVNYLISGGLIILKYCL